MKKKQTTNNFNLFESLHNVAAESGISKEEIEEILSSAMLSAYKKQYPGATNDVSITFDNERGSIILVSQKMVVNKPSNQAEEIALDEAKKIKPDAVLGDEILVEENPLSSFGRIAAQTAKQVIIQKINESKKNLVYDAFKGKEGELINGYFLRKVKDSMIYVDLGKGNEGIMPKREQSPKDHYGNGDRIKALILKVEKNSKSSGIILSRTDPLFIQRLFEMEIPEIYDGIVKIVRIVREPGLRTKIAVTSDREEVDCVGACVGMRGIRIQSIVRELEGEKIDIVEWSPDKKILTANAIVPAKAKEIIEKNDGGVIVVVDNDHYSFAVGKNGHNVRLASRLCGFDIDLKTEVQYREFLAEHSSRDIVERLFANSDNEETPLEDLQEIDARTRKMLEDAGILSVEDLVEQSYEDLVKIDGIGEKTARRILEIIAESVDFDETDENGESIPEDEESALAETSGEKSEMETDDTSDDVAGGDVEGSDERDASDGESDELQTDESINADDESMKE